MILWPDATSPVAQRAVTGDAMIGRISISMFRILIGTCGSYTGFPRSRLLRLHLKFDNFLNFFKFCFIE